MVSRETRPSHSIAERTTIVGTRLKTGALSRSAFDLTGSVPSGIGWRGLDSSHPQQRAEGGEFDMIPTTGHAGKVRDGRGPSASWLPV